MASELKVNKITPESGLTLTLGDSGDTINFGSGGLPNFENLTVTGDLTVDTNSLKVDSTNNFVGIGTASPTVALDVVGAITATGNITGTLATAAQPNITSLGTLTGLTTAGNINLGDNYKINLGASNDLQIYHDGSHSIIADAGTGNLEFRGTHLVARNGGDTGNYFQAIDGAQVELYYNGSSKMSTTSTGIDVTGTVVSDGLTVDGGGSFTQAGGGLKVFNNGTAGYNANIFFGISDQTDGWSIGQGITANDGVFRVYDNGAGRARMAVTTDGDISFYEDTGTTPKFFWDASEERLGIGTTSPDRPLDIESNVPAVRLTDTSVSGLYHEILGDGNSLSIEADDGNIASDSSINFKVDASERMRIDSSGNVGIGTSSPLDKMHIYEAVNNATATQLLIQNEGAGSNSAGIAFQVSDSSETTGFAPKAGIIFERTLPNGRGPLKFFNDGVDDTNGFSAGDEAMRIDSSGNVGIGTSSPASKLEVEDSVNGDMHLRINNTNTGSSARTMLLLQSDGATGSLYLNGANRVSSGVDEADSMTLTSDASASNGLNINATSGSIKFYYNSLEKMRIKSNGEICTGLPANYGTDPTSMTGAGKSNMADQFSASSNLKIARSGDAGIQINRCSDDGNLMIFRQDGTNEGTISVSGATVAYNGFTGTHWSRLSDNSKPCLLYTSPSPRDKRQSRMPSSA